MSHIVEGGETRTVITGDTVTQTIHARISGSAVRRRDCFERLAGCAPLHTACHGRVRSYPWRGEDLIMLVERLGSSVTPDHVRAWCSALCQRCVALHARGIVHGDIKPENVCVHPRTGDVALIDFGAAMRIADEGMEWMRGRDPRRAENAIVGTTNYTVPQWRRRTSWISTTTQRRADRSRALCCAREIVISVEFCANWRPAVSARLSHGELAALVPHGPTPYAPP